MAKVLPEGFEHRSVSRFDGKIGSLALWKLSVLLERPAGFVAVQFTVVHPIGNMAVAFAPVG
jgi:hypothetical protein